MACSRILVSGKVQGVFFRQMTRVVAERHGVRGWVRNLDDGRVEAVLEGDGGAVGEVISWARAGPAGSRVSGIEVSRCGGPCGFAGFEVRY
ncbi:MAG: acylphosphatase [Nitrosopumilus sp.]|nr:acylphosphatase [Nitrosopumilus sp.]CAI9832399.1 Acylphosphatase [Nitrosopumilaceae archaeon]MDA7941916.1 acylphosphatase [Nitrosopumilus sp.]MDA7943100.1 acylphosphatase [Nitrosopumilus sp.]MDA7945190.1 acylphosphatase [Nitrosopumilus sp.]